VGSSTVVACGDAMISSQVNARTIDSNTFNQLSPEEVQHGSTDPQRPQWQGRPLSK
jgi:hypothetical protein